MRWEGWGFLSAITCTTSTPIFLRIIFMPEGWTLKNNESDGHFPTLQVCLHWLLWFSTRYNWSFLLTFQPACVLSTRSSRLCLRRWSFTGMGWETDSWTQSMSMNFLRFRVLWMAQVDQSTSKLLLLMLEWKVLQIKWIPVNGLIFVVVWLWPGGEHCSSYCIKMD